MKRADSNNSVGSGIWGAPKGVDRGEANSTDIGKNVEENNQDTKTREKTGSNSREITRGWQVGAELGVGVRAVTAGISGGYNQEDKESKTESDTNSKSNSNGWSRVNSDTKSSQRNIETRICDNSNFETNSDKSEGNSTSKENGESKGRQKTKSFSVPGYFVSVRNSASISKAEKHFKEYSGAIAVSSRKCTTYKLEIQANNPPSFTEEFKVAVQSLHSLTLETRPYRLIVVKAGVREFNTTLNSTTETRFDSAFSDFIREESNKYFHE